MSLSDEQQSLLQEITSKLDALDGSKALTRFMGQVLTSLLRRKGDAEFLATIQDTFIAGMAERGPDQQRALARELIRVVIETRPEIALAWRAQQGQADGEPLRRAADLAAARQAASEESPPPPPLPPMGLARAQAERMMVDFFAETVEQRLAVFRIPAARFPSAAYCHEQPFFLLSAVFSKVLIAFVGDVLAVQCRDQFERQIFTKLDGRGKNTPESVEAFMKARRLEILHILQERLIRLTALHGTAEDKLAKAKAESEAGGAAWKTVEVPVSQPRVLNVLGVKFTVGQKTAMRKVKVKAGAEHEIRPAEMETLALITRLRDMAADAGLELPPTCDFRFLADLLDFDHKRFAQTVKDLATAAMVGDRNLLFDRLDATDRMLPDTLADAALMMLFTQQADRGFGFQDLYDFSVGAKLGEERKRARPFLSGELARRPRELAFQIREVLRRHGDEETLAATVQALFTVWQVLPRSRFGAELDGAAALLTAFPVAFAGDPDEAAFTEIAQVLQQTLSAQVPNWDRGLLAVRAAYYPVLKRRTVVAPPEPRR